jgi:hypothetical protein
MAKAQSGRDVKIEKGPATKQAGKTNANMKTMGRNRAKIAAQKRGG